MLKLRLKKYGRKNQPCYRIVAIDSRVKRDGKPVEELGFYNPITKETHLKIDRIVSRLEKGAQPSDTVRDLLVKAKVL
jgi:small subunit ribosomal protein S16